MWDGGEGARLVGHQLVTGACLTGLAIRRGGSLATLDQPHYRAVGTQVGGRECGGVGRENFV